MVLLLVLIGVSQAVTVRWWLGLQWPRLCPHLAGSWYRLLAGPGGFLFSSVCPLHVAWVLLHMAAGSQKKGHQLSKRQCAGGTFVSITHANVLLFKVMWPSLESVWEGIPPGREYWEVWFVGDHQSYSLQQDWIPTLHFNSCVTLGKLLFLLPMPQLSH